MATAQKVLAEKIISDDAKPAKKSGAILIKDKDGIRALLKKIFSRHTLLTISIGHNEEFFGSTILEINEAENYLVIDELHPSEGHALLDAGTVITINTQYQGALVRFNIEIQAFGDNSDGAYYKIGIPDSIEYHQRRNSYRVYVGINETIPVTLKTDNDVTVSAELRDISLGGVSLRVKELSHVPLKQGDIISHCAINISEQKRIISSLTICHIEKIQETGTLRIGAAFATMSNIDQRNLENAIMNLEREMIKKLKRTND